MENLHGIFRESSHHAVLGSPKRRKNDPFSSQNIPKGVEDNSRWYRGRKTAIYWWLDPQHIISAVQILSESINQDFLGARGTWTLMKPPESQINKHQPILAFKSPLRHSKPQDSKEAETHAHLFHKLMHQATKDYISYSVMIQLPQRSLRYFHTFISDRSRSINYFLWPG